LAEKRQALLTLTLIETLHEFPYVGFEKLPARVQVGGAAQNCQHFFTQTVMSFLANQG